MLQYFSLCVENPMSLVPRTSYFHMSSVLITCEWKHDSDFKFQKLMFTSKDNDNFKIGVVLRL